MIEYFKIENKVEKNHFLKKMAFFLKQGFYCKFKPRTLSNGSKYFSLQNVSGNRKINVEGKTKYIDEVYSKYQEGKSKSTIKKKKSLTYKGNKIDDISRLRKKKPSNIKGHKLDDITDYLGKKLNKKK